VAISYTISEDVAGYTGLFNPTKIYPISRSAPQLKGTPNPKTRVPDQSQRPMIMIHA